jgi:hypothetical protein
MQEQKRKAPLDRRHYEPEELEQIAACSIGTGALLDLSHELKRPYNAVRAKRWELRRAAEARQASGAFLLDNGVPYRVLMHRVHQEFARTP